MSQVSRIIFVFVFQTFVHSDEETRPESSNDNDKDQDNDRIKDNPSLIESCDIWDTDYNSGNWEPEFMTNFVTIKSDTGQNSQFLRCFFHLILKFVVIMQNIFINRNSSRMTFVESSLKAFVALSAPKITLLLPPWTSPTLFRSTCSRQMKETMHVSLDASVVKTFTYS